MKTDRALLARAREVLIELAQAVGEEWAHTPDGSEQEDCFVCHALSNARALHTEITAALAEGAGEASETMLAKLVMDWVAGHASEVDMVMCASKITAGEVPAPSTFAADLQTSASASGRGQPAPDDGWRDIASAPSERNEP